MGNWKEFEIKDFKGISTANRNPQKNECYECMNLDLRENTGDLITRGGYAVKYTSPDDSRDKLASQASLAFENFYIPDIGGGQEVTCLIQKATISGETGILYAAPASINAILIWIRKWWDGSTWQDSWQWLNQTILTKVSAVDGYKIKLDMADTSVIASNYFRDWTIVNITKNEIARVIKTYDYGSTTVGVKIANNSFSWSAEDVVYLMKNYIPVQYLSGNYGASFSDVAFHKILNDLKISFGGYENRLALSIGYRKKYWKLESFNFGSGDTDLDSESAVESFATIDRITLDPIIPIKDSVRLDIVTSAGSLDIGDYYFKVVGTLDGFDYFQIYETKITIDAKKDFIITPRIDWAILNKRITSIKIFWADSLLVYYLLEEIDLSGATYSKSYSIENDGQASFPSPSGTNLNTTSNAVLPGTDSNGLTGWSVYTTYTDDTSVDASVIPPQDGTYCIKLERRINSSYYGYNGIKHKHNLGTGIYDFHFYLKVESPVTVYYGLNEGDYPNPFGDDSVVIPKIKSIAITETGWVEISDSFKVQNPDSDFIIYFPKSGPCTWIAFDNLRITKGTYNPSLTSKTEKINEMSDDLGYKPSFDYARSWDQAIVSQGKAFLINPYIDKRYQNKIFFSHLFQYDVITAQNYYDLENFDGNDLIGTALLSNLNLLSLKRNSAQQTNTQTGGSSYIQLGSGIISRKSAVNFGDMVMYCNENGIIASDGMNYKDLSEGSIRDQYRALAPSFKSAIIAGREEKDNSYRFFSCDTTSKAEFIYTPRGWIKQVQNIYPADYTLAKDGSLWFMRNGAIYDRTPGSGDAGATIPFSWKSVPIDISLSGENITGNMRWYIDSVWIYFTQLSAMAITMKLYFDNGTTEFQSFTASYDSAGTKRFQKQTKLGAMCRSFQIGISGSDSLGGQIIIHSLGVLYKILPVGR